jgi:hypothetical protein
MEEELDDSWIKEFKKLESDYDDFYKETPSSVKVFFLYTAKNNTVESLKEDTVLLEEGYLRKETLIGLIRAHSAREGVKHRLLSLIKYNFTIDPRDVTDLIRTEDDGARYITSEKYLHDIKFEDTVCIFQDINALFFLFYEDTPRQQSTTKKVFIKKRLRKTRRKMV